MFIDRRLQVSNQQVVTAAGPSTDSIDLGSLRQIGPGEQLWMVAVARAALAGTINFQIQVDDNSAFSSPATPFTSQTYTAAEAPAGRLFAFPFPYSNERHVRANFGGAPTGGTWDVWFTNQDPQTWQALPDAI